MERAIKMPKFLKDFLEWRESNQREAVQKLAGLGQTKPLSFWEGWYYHVILFDLWNIRIVLLWAVVFAGWYFL